MPLAIQPNGDPKSHPIPLAKYAMAQIVKAPNTRSCPSKVIITSFRRTTTSFEHFDDFRERHVAMATTTPAK